MNKAPLLYLGHILTCVKAILEYTNSMIEKDFIENKLVQDAVLRNFEVIGEATKQIEESFRAKYPQIPW